MDISEVMYLYHIHNWY